MMGRAANTVAAGERCCRRADGESPDHREIFPLTFFSSNFGKARNLLNLTRAAHFNHVTFDQWER
ncbi:hypothetical protein [Nevskia sp.]|uniref:hypothetical protein n=1 Tax=Nevskia sp. TaxID=1929292 RepID=UPI0025D66C69|nr:hypothetical protein [Nevskia sp.]